MSHKVSSMTLRKVLCLGILLLAIGLSAQVTTTQAATTLYDSGTPTSAEQLVLEYINRARANPTAEGTRLGIAITEGLANPSLVGVRPPLAMNKFLLSAARAHSQDMWTRNYFTHVDPDGHDPGYRMTAAGYTFVGTWRWGENIATGSAGYSAAALEDLLMVDASTSGRGHRVNLLDIYIPPYCSEVGIGYYAASTPNPSGWSNFITQDFAVTSNAGPFLLGVVYNDLNGNNFYDIGEGISGVTITPSVGTYYAISSTSGGYAFPIGTSGTITVTASGSGFSTTTKQVTLTGANIKLDFTAGNPPTPFGTTVSTVFADTSYTLGFMVTGNIYDNSGILGMYAHRSPPKIIFPKTDTSRVSPTGQPTWSGYTHLVTVGGRGANPTLAYYEDNGKATLKFYFEGGNYVIKKGTTVAYTIVPSSVTTTNDYFVMEAIPDGTHTVISLWGIGAPGTYASGIYFDGVFPTLSSLTQGWYIVRWQDLNSNGFPDYPTEFTIVASG